MRSFWRMFGVIALLTGIATAASAQIDQGRLTGSVVVAQNAVLPGVTVTAKSPALMGIRTVVTESDGKYSIAALPSGEYEMTFELPGFTAFKRGNLKLALGQIMTVDAQMHVDDGRCRGDCHRLLQRRDLHLRVNGHDLAERELQVAPLEGGEPRELEGHLIFA